MEFTTIKTALLVSFILIYMSNDLYSFEWESGEITLTKPAIYMLRWKKVEESIT